MLLAVNVPGQNVVSVVISEFELGPVQFNPRLSCTTVLFVFVKFIDV